MRRKRSGGPSAWVVSSVRIRYFQSFVLLCMVRCISDLASCYRLWLPDALALNQTFWPTWMSGGFFAVADKWSSYRNR